jgi:hypothetical protein
MVVMGGSGCGGYIKLTCILFAFKNMCVRARARACVCVCVCVYFFLSFERKGGRMASYFGFYFYARNFPDIIEFDERRSGLQKITFLIGCYCFLFVE